MATRKAQTPSLLTFFLSLLPIAYFAGFLWYFSDVGGNRVAGIVDNGLGPTVAGIGLLVVLMSIKPIIDVLRFLLGADWVTSQHERQGIVTADSPAAGGDFDADAALARYMAGRGSAAQAEGPSPPPPPRRRPRARALAASPVRVAQGCCASACTGALGLVIDPRALDAPGR
jgi:hypothetical protein